MSDDLAKRFNQMKHSNFKHSSGLEGVMSEELKPCPFCGGEAAINIDGDYPTVNCMGHDGPDYPNGFDGCSTFKYSVEAWNTRADHIPEASKMMWISVDDRLPDDNGWYLVHHSGGMLFSRELIDGTYFKSKKLWANAKADKYGQITHWMPLPEPPNITES